jgi:hypothetical protein
MLSDEQKMRLAASIESSQTTRNFEQQKELAKLK